MALIAEGLFWVSKMPVADLISVWGRLHRAVYRELPAHHLLYTELPVTLIQKPSLAVEGIPVLFGQDDPMSWRDRRQRPPDPSFCQRSGLLPSCRFGPPQCAENAGATWDLMVQSGERVSEVAPPCQYEEGSLGVWGRHKDINKRPLLSTFPCYTGSVTH